jgi:ribosomal-protein-alanine N-acetyltransferase
MTLDAGDNPIETERLLLRRIAVEDLPFYARIHSDPDVARYISHGNPRTVEESRIWLEQVLQSYETVGLGQLAVTLKSDGSLLGRCGLSHMELDTSPASDGAKVGYYFPARAPAGITATVEAELGYTFDKSAWGKGYAVEAVTAVYAYATRRLRRRGIISLIHADNAPSMRLANKFGVQYVDLVSLWGRRFNRYRWPEAT